VGDIVNMTGEEHIDGMMAPAVPYPENNIVTLI
jgi:hypothetical protein